MWRTQFRACKGPLIHRHQALQLAHLNFDNSRAAIIADRPMGSCDRGLDQSHCPRSKPWEGLLQWGNDQDDIWYSKAEEFAKVVTNKDQRNGQDSSEGYGSITQIRNAANSQC